MPVIKHALLAIFGLIGFCLPLAAQSARLENASDAETITVEELDETGAVEVGSALNLLRPDLFTGVDSAVLLHGVPALTLLNGRRFPISTELGRMGWAPFDVVPLAFLSTVEVQKVGSSPRYGSDRPGGVINLRTDRWKTGGEAGVFYGRSDGRNGREDYSGYIIGTVGNEHFSLSAGASYQESTGQGLRSRR